MTRIPVTAISHYECGRREPNLRNLRLIAMACRVSADYLIGHDLPCARVPDLSVRTRSMEDM